MFKKNLTYATLLSLIGLTTLYSSKALAQDKEVEKNPATQVVPISAKDLIGRWDLIVDKGDTQSPSWIEIKLSGYNTLVGAWVGDSGSQRPISEIKLKDSKFSFAIPPQWEGGQGDIVIEGELAAGKLKGSLITNKGKKYLFSGEKAPYLNRSAEVKWSKEINLFNGKDLTGWKASSENNQWVVTDGILTSKKAGANLISLQKFEDFKIEAEFRYPEGGNSGIYLRGRYEVQIEDSPMDRHPGSLYFGGVYGFLSPNKMVALGPNQWQKFEITLIGRLVTVVANGKTIIANQEIPGITGGALDSKEGEPGPIYLQGDHAPIEFRKIKIIPAIK